ncbi:hypothetical protein BDY24DRAFT_412219 [Mrakia frigida]|uniref:uncharacterized protein n=1 Tax=Mrakia frigida TaxID=29902 RepID=UPI003FCC1C3F
MSISIPESFRFIFTTGSPTGTFPPVIEACSTMNFSFTTIANIEESPTAPYTPVFYVQEPGKTPYSFAGPSIPSSEKGTMPLPFNNSQVGTQFVTCMFAANNQTGGCQNVYTVTQASRDCQIDGPPGTTNWPAVGEEDILPMSMQSAGSTGVLTDVGQFSSWPMGCSDLVFKPGGKPPYLLTIANAYIPPRNYTFDSSEFSWKIDLSRAYPFFVSVFDSTGLSYTAGPLHVGGGGSTKCLAGSLGGGGTSTTVTAGVAVGALILGALVAFGGMWGFNAWRKKHPIPLFSPVEEADYVPTPYSHSYLDRADSTTSRQGQGAPNRRPSQHSNYAQHSSYGRLGDDDSEARSPLAGSGVFQAISTRRGSMGGYSDPYNPRQSIAGSSSSGGWKDSKGGRGQQGGGGKESDGEMEMGRRGGRGEGGGRGESQSLMGRNVFVVHHDGGGAPVTVFTDEGTEIVELPPSYRNAGPTIPDSSPSNSRQPTQRRPSEASSPPVLNQPLSASPQQAPTLLPIPSIASQTEGSSTRQSDPFITPPGGRSDLPPVPLESRSPGSSFSPPPPAAAPLPAGPNRAVSRLSSSGPGASRVGGPRPSSSGGRKISDPSTSIRE